MADEPVVIEATAGPYAGQRLTVAAAEAKKAIAEGWAKDPFAAPEEPKEMTEDERVKVLEAAHKGARRLRGEEEPVNGKKAKEDRALEADKPAATYETRSTPPKSR
jgi:hypothetical protein